MKRLRATLLRSCWSSCPCHWPGILLFHLCPQITVSIFMVSHISGISLYVILISYSLCDFFPLLYLWGMIKFLLLAPFCLWDCPVSFPIVSLRFPILPSLQLELFNIPISLLNSLSKSCIVFIISFSLLATFFDHHSAIYFL